MLNSGFIYFSFVAYFEAFIVEYVLLESLRQLYEASNMALKTGYAIVAHDKPVVDLIEIRSKITVFGAMNMKSVCSMKSEKFGMLP